MSGSGELADIILEQLRGGKKIDVDELKQKLSLKDTEILDFMNECGLITLEKGEGRITGFGSELLTLE